jgi:hypothetical protein
MSVYMLQFFGALGKCAVVQAGWLIAVRVLYVVSASGPRNLVFFGCQPHPNQPHSLGLNALGQLDREISLSAKLDASVKMVLGRCIVNMIPFTHQRSKMKFPPFLSLLLAPDSDTSSIVVLLMYPGNLEVHP